MADTALPSGFHATPEGDDDRVISSLLAQIREIGLARFIGRINAGVIPTDQGYQAVERFVSVEKRRPFISDIARALAGHRGS